jgi:hypothetical protein
MTHPTTFDGCFVPTFAIEMFEAEFFGKAAHAVSFPKTFLLTEGGCPMGRDQCSRCHDSGLQ